MKRLLFSCLLVVAAAMHPSAQTPTSYWFTTVAGAPPSGTNGSAVTARFGNPAGIAVDQTGNVFVVDRRGFVVRKVTPAGDVTTYAGVDSQAGTADGLGAEVRFLDPSGIVVSADGSLYVTDRTMVRRVAPDGRVTTVAGHHSASAHVDGTGDGARFVALTGAIAIAADGHLYVGDQYAIRRVTTAGVVTTAAGLPSSAGINDGTGTDARFGAIGGITAGPDGALYVTDRRQLNVTGPCCGQTVRRMTTAGVVTTIAGVAGSTGGVDGFGVEARFNEPAGIVTRSDGTLLVADRGGHTLRTVTTAGLVTTLAGRAGEAGWIDNDDPSAARFDTPSAMARDAAGQVYIADAGTKTIRRLASDGRVTTIAGRPAPDQTDGVGAAARFRGPAGVTVAADGSLYVADYYGHRIRRVSATGAVTTIAGAIGGGLFDGHVSEARFNFPTGIAVTASGTAYVADYGNARLRAISPQGQVTTVALAPQTGNPRLPAVVARGEDVFYLAGQAVYRLAATGPELLAGAADQAGDVDATGGAARFRDPWGLAIDATGTLFVADTGNGRIPRVTSSGVVTTIGNAIQARGIAVGPDGRVFVSQGIFCTVGMLGADGSVVDVGGAYQFAGSTDSAEGAPLFSSPWGLAVAATGDVFVADFDNGTIRRGVPDARVVPLTVVSQPQSAVVPVGGTAVFRFATTGVPGAIVRWQQSASGPSGPWSNLHEYSVWRGVSTPVLTIPAVSGQVMGIWYRAIAYNGYSSVTSDAALLLAEGLPQIGTHPSNQTVIVGDTATFTVTHGNGAPLPTYQWERSTDGATFVPVVNDSEHAGASTATLRVTPASRASTGARYRVVLTNSYGSTTSHVATLTVFSLRIVTQPANQVVRVGTAVSLTVGVAAAGAPVYRWQYTWDQRAPWTDVVNGPAISGATTPTLTINPSATSHTGYYRVIVVLGDEEVWSNSPYVRVASTELRVTPSVMRFAASKAGADGDLLAVTSAQSLTVAYTGNIVPLWSMTADQPWLSLSRDTFGGARTTPVAINNAGNVIGGATELTGTITIVSTQMPWLSATVTVHLSVDQSGGATSKPFGVLDTPVSGSGGHAGPWGSPGGRLTTSVSIACRSGAIASKRSTGREAPVDHPRPMSPPTMCTSVTRCSSTAPGRMCRRCIRRCRARRARAGACWC